MTTGWPRGSALPCTTQDWTGANAKMALAAPAIACSRPAAGGRCRHGGLSAPWRPARHCPRSREEPRREAEGGWPGPEPPSSLSPPLPSLVPARRLARPPPPRFTFGKKRAEAPLPAFVRRFRPARPRPPASVGGGGGDLLPTLPSLCVRPRARRRTSRRGARRRRQLTAHPRK